MVLTRVLSACAICRKSWCSRRLARCARLAGASKPPADFGALCAGASLVVYCQLAEDACAGGLGSPADLALTPRLLSPPQLDMSTEFGAFLDPVADKLMVTTALILLTTAPPRPVPSAAMAVPVLFVVGREIAMSSLREWAAKAGGNAHKVPLLAAAHPTPALPESINSRLVSGRSESRWCLGSFDCVGRCCWHKMHAADD